MAALHCYHVLSLLLLQLIYPILCYRNATDVIRMISKHADRRFRPFGTEALPVQIGLTILDIDINEKTLDYTMDVYLRLSWTDERLKYDENDHGAIYLTKAIADQFLWIPEIHFVNGREESPRNTKLTSYGAMLKPGGEISYSTKATIQSECSGEQFSRYPMETHNCSLKLETFMMSVHDMILSWKYVEFDDDCNAGSFSVSDKATTQKITSYAIGDFQTLIFWFTLERNSKAVMCLSILPSFLLVCLSCILFWLPLSALTERTIFSTTLLLIVTVIAVVARQGAPSSNQLNFLDIWLLGCFIFLIFATLEVIALVLVSRRFYTKRNTFELVDDDVRGSSSEDINKSANNGIVPPQLMKKVDMGMRIIYPAAFIIFAVVYFCVLAF